MKPLIPVIISVLLILASCKGGENKADQSNQEPFAPMTDTATVQTAPVETPGKPAPSGQSRGIETNEPVEIISRIDAHLVTSAKFTAVPGGGISDCMVTVTNTLPDVTFQKALVEVSIKKDDGGTVKTDYYTVVNIEPGMSKLIKVPNSSQGSKVITAIMKVKSMELTNGEFVLAGNHSSPQ